MYQRIATLIPKPFADKIRESLRYLDINIDEKQFLGFLLAFGLAFGISMGILLMLLFQIHFLLGFFGTIALLFGGVYMWLNLAADAKARFVESVLPDALQLIASNVKSGLTTERALFISARPEFGPLELELKRASRQILAGASLQGALIEMGTRVKSNTFERTMWLIARGIQSGGQIADLLIQLGDDLREQRAIQEETNAETSMYILLILISAAFGAPVLFGVSSFITEILSNQLKELPTINPEAVANAPANVQQITNMLPKPGHQAITPEFVVQFSIVAMLFTAIFASMTLGVIVSGKEKYGIKYFPVVFVASLFLFYIIRLVLSSIFGNLIG